VAVNTDSKLILDYSESSKKKPLAQSSSLQEFIKNLSRFNSYPYYLKDLLLTTGDEVILLVLKPTTEKK